MLRIPSATYRIQFNAQFTFAQARAIAAYLAKLGISDIYASPILRPRKGSTHGYDIVDPHAVNPELGTDDDFMELTGELDRLGMGFLLDIVPNHMAASHENAWWMSVLENGAESRYRSYFDIDWQREKVLLPILGKPYGEALESGEIKLGFDAGGLFLSYYDHRLPVAPRAYKHVLRECVESLPKEGFGIELHELVQNDSVILNSRFIKESLWRMQEQSHELREAIGRAVERFNNDVDALDRLIDAQWYRLAYWRIASETINYRRFFDVTDLVGLCIDNPEVFEMRNERILQWMIDRKVTGLRIDHIDGLRKPIDYLTRLQLRLSDPATEEREQCYVVVEKILAHGEHLPPGFACAGTTGYDFLDIVNNVFVDPDGLGALDRFYRAHTGFTGTFEDMVYERKKQVIKDLFFGEMRALGTHLGQLAVSDRNARDFAPSELLAALEEVTACMPVYRTYVREHPVSDDDRDIIRRAVREAGKRARGIDERLFHFVELVLLVEPPEYIADRQAEWLEFVLRWQQFTPRVMAKGVEDTAFYNFNRLISMNEVGGEPGRGELDPVAELHGRNARMLRDWPLTMNATSTHDTKRAEDVRARISVLSEIPDEWARIVRRWSKMNAPLKIDGVPHPNEELLVYQTLVGMWPLDAAEVAGVPDRLRAYLEKASREAKTHSSWLTPNEKYEKALQDFAVAILDNEEFRASFEKFQKRIAYHGYLNSLAQVVLKATSPGIPDFYQGSELWDFSLVDPDNRRPVDYEVRAKLLASVEKVEPASLVKNWRDGRVKLFVTARTLAARARHGETFRTGAYEALDAGPNVVAYRRGDDILVAVPRLTTRDAAAEATLPEGRWRHVFTGAIVEGGTFQELLAAFPVALLERAG